MKTIHRFIRNFLTVLLIVSILTIPILSADSVPGGVMRSVDSVVRIVSDYLYTGTGFVIKSDGTSTLIVTNHHVVGDNPDNILVYVGQGQIVTAQVLADTPDRDMCVLELAYPVSIPALKLEKQNAARGDAVYAVGFPSVADLLSGSLAQTSAEATITNGIVSAVRQTNVVDYGLPVTLLQTNAEINPGNSGGPLFNSKGNVIGINTIGMNNSQGIFGAIAVSELRSFLQENHITIPDSRSPALIVAVVGAALVFAALGILVVLRRKVWKMKRGAGSSVPSCTLRQYIMTHPEGLGTNKAASLLMPVAIQLRDMHNNGRLHLQISPDRITVTASGAALEAASGAETDRFSSGFAAPEVYTGKGVGFRTDVYSFCAVLYYACTGTVPENSLTRGEDSGLTFPDNIDGDLKDLLCQGMAVLSEDRPASVQELIAGLAPYYTPITAETPAQTAPVSPVSAVQTPGAQTRKEKTLKPRKRGKRLLFAGLAVLILLIASYLGAWGAASAYADKGDFNKAAQWARIPLPDSQLTRYIAAGQLMETRQFKEANAAFAEMHGYRNSSELARESLYRFAAQQVDARKYGYAITLYNQLAEVGYKDAEDKVNETKYRQAVYLIREKGDYKEALAVLSALERAGYPGTNELILEANYQWGLEYLKRGSFPAALNKLTIAKDYDNGEALNTVKEAIYLLGQTAYDAGEYDQAIENFSMITSYKRSRDYLSLSKAWQTYTQDNYAEAIRLIGFEDAKDILVSTHRYALRFLEGDWRDRNGKLWLSVDGGELVKDAFPYVQYLGYYYIKDGIFYVCDKNETTVVADKKIQIIDYNTIKMYCYADSSTHTLYRK